MSEASLGAAGALRLLNPKARTKLARIRTDQGRAFKTIVLGFVGLFFWSLIFSVIWRMLLYFRNTQGVGDLLAGKLLGLALLTFMGILLLSNVITSLSTFFLSQDLELLMASPTDALSLYGARLVETIVNSSWMVGLLAVPLFLAYGIAYRADVGFYILAGLVTVPFLVLPAVVGVGVTLLLVNVFPARRTRDLLALIGLFAAAGIVAVFRFLRPERLVRPEEFRDLVDFLAVLRTPSSVWLPNEWATESLMSYLNGVFDPFPALLLLSTAAAFVVVGAWLHLRFFQTGYSRAQEGATRQEHRSRSTWVEGALGWLPSRARVLVAKEIRVFFRDSTQWSQLLLLGVLVVVYVYNVKVLPLYSGEQVSFFLINVVSFLNLGLAGFVVAAIAARFVFPAMSLEGRMMWLLRSSPLDVRALFWSKYWVGTLPLLLVAIPLIVATNWILEVSPLIFALSTGTMVIATLTLTALALSFGALFPNYDSDNVAEIPTSFGGLLFMMAAVGYLVGVIVLEAWPVYSYLAGNLRDEPVRNFFTVQVVMGIAGAMVLSAVAIAIPIRAGMRKVGALDFQ
jgi:ABC-2 type transport system permease protein